MDMATIILDLNEPKELNMKVYILYILVGVMEELRKN